MIYLLTAIGLSPGGSIHLHTNSTKNNTNNNRTTQIQQYRQEWTGSGWFFLFQSILPECTASHGRSHGLRALKFPSLGFDYKSSWKFPSVVLKENDMPDCICISMCNKCPGIISTGKGKRQSCPSPRHEGV